MSKKIIFAIAVLSLIILVIFLSKKEHQVEIQTTDAILWDCENETDIHLSEIIDSTSFIPIETNENALIGEISKLTFYNNFFFILDCNYTATLYVFESNTGKFVRKIGRIGSGPGEYNRIYDFSIDEKEKIIYLLCDKEKVISYTLSGLFIAETKISFYATAIEFFNDKFHFVCEDDNKDNLIITDKKYNIISSYFPNKEYGENGRILVHPFQKTKKGILYRRFLDNNIYKINANGEVSLLYQIDLGTNLLKIDNIKSLTPTELKSELKQKRCHIKYFVENDNYAIIYFFDKNKPYVSIYNKNSKEVKTSLLQSVTDNFIHKKFPLFEYISDQNDFIIILQPNEINDAVPLKNNIKESISEDSNPILYILHSK